MVSFIKPKSLMSVSKDNKTIKGQKYGILTGILYLAPHNISGYQVCPKATVGCSTACLFSSGHGSFSTVKQARINRTHWFFNERTTFMAEIVSDLEALIKRSKTEDMVPACRLNGTSDIAWEKIKCVRGGVQYRNLMQAFREIKFYDYSKIATRKVNEPNYHLTFSLAEDNDKDAIKALSNGMNVAVVMRVKRRTDKKPKTWGGYPVVDGDTHDARFIDPKGGHIVALYPKGKAGADLTGFVREITAGFRV